MSPLPDTKSLDEIIVGRVEPHIYAFLTTSVPRYLKVGDTYRPVPVRIAEWQKHFSIDAQRDVWDWPAVLDDEVFFRDYSVHQFLQDSRHLVRLDKTALTRLRQGKDLYFSNEFFLDARKEHVEEALADIKDDHDHSTGKYSFYSVKNAGRPADEEELPPPVPLTLRPNQREAVERFKEAVGAGRTNLLMYAVMRFGKTVAALQCAKELAARFVVVVSGKADVAREWRNTVLGFTDFKNHFVFLSRKDLDAKYSRVTEELAARHKVVLFATLQDLQGDAIKPRHEQIFANPIDLLVIDETHFAARAAEYGKVIRMSRKDSNALRVPKKYAKADASEEASAEDAAQAVKALDAKVRLHLSGTPYRILMGSEFQKEDIVSFCQFTDIANEQRKWDEEHLGQDEWDNPYYGFPQMVRFAFNLNESARKKLQELEADGQTSRFRELFRPVSMEKDTSSKQLHKKFVHEKEVADLLRAIGGSAPDPGILPFLDYDKIVQGQMCHHIVCVLPWCASCDALEALLSSRKHKRNRTFGKLHDYKILNISGKEVKRGFVKIADVAKTIADCETRKEKTLTLTVNRMLTGSTVPEWDTMLFLKDTSSPQEYDQAVFRLQSSFVRSMPDGRGREIKYNMKPQTLLVDFDPARMFRLQEARAQAYNVNTERNGNAELENRVRRELEVSPIILFNKDRIHRVEASDVMAVISQYSAKRGVAEEVEDIPVDRSVLADSQLSAFIDRLPALGSREGLTIKPHTGDETDIDAGEASENGGTDDGGGAAPPPGEDKDREDRDRNIKTLHALVVFYSFLVPERVHSLDEILQVIDQDDNNRRIARHLGLTKDILGRYRDKVGWQTLQKLDYKIQNLDRLANETQDIDLGEEYKDTPEPVKKAVVAMRKFGRLGEAKVVTPPNIAYDMVRQIPAAELKALVESGEKILDPASKMGEFAIAIVRRCAEPDIGLAPDALKTSILSIPMCGVTYEFTRKVYQLLGLAPKCIAQPENMTTYDLLTLRKPGTGRPSSRPLDFAKIKRLLTQNKDFDTISIGDDLAGEDDTMCNKIGLVISNPPYQEDDGGFASSASPVYNHFVEAATSFEPRCVTLITPSRWFAGGKGLDDFRAHLLSDHRMRTLVDFPMLYEPFSNVKIRGGISYFLWDGKHDGPCHVMTMEGGKPIGESAERYLDEFDILVRRNEAVPILRKVRALNEKTLDAKVSSRKPFGFPTNFLGTESAEGISHPVKLYGNQKVTWVDRSAITTNPEWIQEWKVLMTAVQGTSAAVETKFLSNPIVAGPGTACTETYLVAGHFRSKSHAQNLANYLRTRFVRFLVSLRKSTQHATRDVYAFVPLQDFSSSSDIDWTRPLPEIDRQLYDKYSLTAPERAFIESMIKPMG
ncbi:MAG: Eco57I restriction-modification methylase domain-containing protein [Kiritimatiellae bacterium]|nr:Eco57I restriction-modification methylase domain-containing protein [Kiritimatiellia bacterium]MBR4253318.1 Eco57I restriction-modification methylase domain-containing protein [Kiritimatiellia bacterium]